MLTVDKLVLGSTKDALLFYAGNKMVTINILCLIAATNPSRRFEMK